MRIIAPSVDNAWCFDLLFVIDLLLICNNLYKTFEICQTAIHQISLYVNIFHRQTYFHIKKIID